LCLSTCSRSAASWLTNCVISPFPFLIHGKRRSSINRLSASRKWDETDSSLARGVYLSDGTMSLALLNYKTDEAAGERGREFVGLHHIGVWSTTSSMPARMWSKPAVSTTWVKYR